MWCCAVMTWRLDYIWCQFTPVESENSSCFDRSADHCCVSLKNKRQLKLFTKYLLRWQFVGFWCGPSLNLFCVVMRSGCDLLPSQLCAVALKSHWHLPCSLVQSVSCILDGKSEGFGWGESCALMNRMWSLAKNTYLYLVSIIKETNK